MSAENPKPRSRRRTLSSGNPELDALLGEFVAKLEPRDRELALSIVTTSLKLASEQVTRLDRKIVDSALKELRFAFRVFAPYKDVRKASIFGSARTEKNDPEYEATRAFSREIAGRGWMVITGAGPGIMEAGHEGAGGPLSFGANIRLPFEAKPNPVIASDPKLINFKYFFTRKLTFIKEAHAFVLLPGGFGTLDETFELLTLVQTGKASLLPIVLLDAPGGSFWRHFDGYLRDELLARRYIDPDDLYLYRCTDDPIQAVEEIERFYRVYHSQRIVSDRVIFRLNTAVDRVVLDKLGSEFEEILKGPIEAVEASATEIRDDDVPNLPRIALDFDRKHIGTLRRLVDRLNDLGSS